MRVVLVFVIVVIVLVIVIRSLAPACYSLFLMYVFHWSFFWLVCHNVYSWHPRFSLFCSGVFFCSLLGSFSLVLCFLLHPAPVDVGGPVWLGLLFVVLYLFLLYCSSPSSCSLAPCSMYRSCIMYSGDWPPSASLSEPWSPGAGVLMVLNWS